MFFTKFRLLICLSLIMWLACTAWGADAKAPLLPKVFAGWSIQNPQSSTDPAKADPTNPDLLKEFGLTGFEQAEYVKPDRKITVRAARFADASGAYGAFTFYKTPEMVNESIGDQGSSDNDRVLFYRGNVLVDVKLDRVTVTSAGELRELASDIPKPSGNAANLPTIPTYLPKQGYVKNSAKYVLGSVGAEKTGVPLPASLIDFSTGAEVAVGQYRTDEGIAQMTLVSYPTPAIAAQRLHEIEAWHPVSPDGAASTIPVFSKRSGPIVVVMTGQISESEAKSMLASVNYDADVTWNQQTKLTKDQNVGSLLVNVIALTGIICGMAIAAGIAFGGVRILLKRLFPDRIFDRSRDIEIIRLDIGK